MPDAPEIWLANPDLQTGTSLFDQFRALPRVHTFDANAASALDWIAVPGVTPASAARLLDGVPYRDLKALLAQADADPPLRQRIMSMDAAMRELRRTSDAEEASQPLDRRPAVPLAVCRLRGGCGGPRRVAGPPGMRGPLALGHSVRPPVGASGVRAVVGRHQPAMGAARRAGDRGRAPGCVVGRAPQALLAGSGRERWPPGRQRRFRRWYSAAAGGKRRRAWQVQTSGGLAAPRGRNRNGAGVSRAASRTSPSSWSRFSALFGSGMMQPSTGQTSTHFDVSKAPTHSVHFSGSIT